jgi:hypothetical protein
MNAPECRAEVRALKAQVCAVFFQPTPGPLAGKHKAVRTLLREFPAGPARREVEAYFHHVLHAFVGATEAPR